MTDLPTLNQKFGIAGLATFEAGAGGLTKLTIKCDLADAEIYLHGAHITRFKPKGEQPILFLSSRSYFQSDKPIRGGVPICFPWFGPKADDAKAPAHGFARLTEWSVESLTSTATSTIAVFTLSPTPKSKSLWPTDFLARYTISVGKALELSLAITNTSAASFNFEEALHTYLTTGDIKKVSIDGLGGTTYLDKMRSAARTPQPDEIKFTGETDRVYLATQATCTVNDPSIGRKIQIAKKGSDSTVIWNPWIDKAKSMADFGDDEWPGMVCVETCNVGESAVTLAPGATHTMATIISATR